MNSNFLSVSAKTALRNWSIAWIVLVVGLIITLTATLYMKSSVVKKAKVGFTSNCNEIKNTIINRLDDHARILLSGAALFNAYETVSREEWRVFNKAQKVEKQLPGIQGIGFSLLIPPAELSRHLQKIRSEGFPQYKLRPDGVREIYSSVIYLEPFSSRNLRAFGYDMLSEPVRRSAMERARDSDAAALSGKVILVQETNQDVQAGTLMYVPVYHQGMPIQTLEQRRAAIYGWVYSPYRMNDLMQGMIGNRHLEEEEQLHLQVFDGTQPSIQSLLYDSHPTGDENLRPGARFTLQIPVDFNGQRWTLRFTQTGGGFATFDYISVWLTLASGMIISLLLFFLTLALLNTRVKAHITGVLAAELRETKEYLENLIDYANVPIVVWNPQYQITRFNHAFASLTGRVAGDVLGNPLKMLFPPDVVASSMEHIKRTQASEHWESLEISILHVNGSVRTVLWNSATIFAADGTSPVATIAQGTDITERKQAETALQMSEERYALALEAVNDGVWDWDIPTGHALFSPNYYALLGYDNGEFTASYAAWRLLVHPEDLSRVEEKLRLSIANGKGVTVEFRMKSKSGPWRWVAIRGRVVRLDAGGRALRMVGTLSDITERKQAETIIKNLAAQNQQLQKDESLGRMAGAIAHRLNNQLHVVMGNLELGMDDLPRAAEPFTTLNIAMQAARQAAEVSQSMLTYLGQTPGKPVLVDLSMICRQSLPLLSSLLPKDVEVKLDLPDPGPAISADASQIQQVLTHLLTNAGESYGDTGGMIQLSIKTLSAGEIAAESRVPIGWQPQAPAYACMEVADAGCGIASKDMNRIFDPFFTTKFTGRGMGLAIVLGIVKTHGGGLTVESKPGCGCVVRAFFPVAT
jgi:PAS domain S-box-containing protein